MSYTLRARLAAVLDVIETVDAANTPASDEAGRTRTYTEYSTEVNLTGNANSYPQIGNQVADLSHTLSGGTTKDFDLTAVPWAGDTSQTFDATGKKLIAILLRMNAGNNAGGVAFGPQGANGYALFGAGLVPKFFPGTNTIVFLADPDQAADPTNNFPTVAAGAKDLRFTGTDADGWECLAIFSE